MSGTVEIVRFEVPSEQAESLVEGHGTARLAMDALAPGWIWSRLARLDERQWIEVVAWQKREAFERSFAEAADDPVAGAWFDLAAPGWTIVLGEPVEAVGPPPPHDGSLELVSARAGEEAALVAAHEAGSRWSLLIETDGRDWTGESWEETAPGLVRLTVPAPDRGPSPPSWIEVATIAHSFDAAGAKP
jgi:hypothetical protein